MPDAAQSAVPGGSSASKPGTILSIQYLRGLAALMVVAHHAGVQFSSAHAVFDWNFGLSGVDLFFVISGFIMVATTAAAPISPAEFWRRRVIRIVPMYWILTTLMVCIWLVAPALFKTLDVSLGTYLKSLLFIPHFSRSFPDHVWPLLVPGWTLNCEMFFYLIFGVALAAPARWRLVFLSVVMLSLAVAGMAFGPFESAAAQMYTNRQLCEFLAGALVAGWWINGRGKLPPVACLVIGLVGFVLMMARDLPPFGVFNQQVGSALVVIAALSPRVSHWNSPVLRALGDASYSIYLTHIFTLGVCRAAWGVAFGAPRAFPGVIAFVLVSSCICAWAGWQVYLRAELPLTRSLRNLGARATRLRTV